MKDTTIAEAQDTAKRLVEMRFEKKLRRAHTWLEGATLESERGRLLAFIENQRDVAWWNRNFFGTIQGFWSALTWSAGVPS